MPLSRRTLTLACIAAAMPQPRIVLAQTAGAVAPGQLLVASPSMSDPNFAHSVILIIQHDTQGALGVIINRPVGAESIADLLKSIGQNSSGAEGSITLFIGGPLQPEIGFIIHSDEYRVPGTIMLGNGIAVTSSLQVLRDIGAGKGPRKRLLIFAYAGWSAQQLESELMLRAWVTAVATPDLVFDVDRKKLWSVAVGRRAIEL